MTKILRSYQKEMLKYTFKVQHPALWVQMRLGKTLVTIRRCKAYSNCNSILIIGPYSCFKSWRDELISEGEEEPLILTGPKGERIDLLYKHWPIQKWFLINKEFNRTIASEIHNMPWDVVILDESTFIKEPQADITRFLLKNFRHVKHRWCLSGFPDPYGPLNYFCQLKFLNQEYLHRYSNFWDFRNKCFDLVGRYKYEMNLLGKRELEKTLSQKCFFLSRKDAGIKEEKIYSQRLIPFPNKILKMYKEIEKDFAYEMEGKEVLTKWATTRFQWMLDLCSGFLDGRFIWEGKLKELKYLMNTELKNEPLVIYCNRIAEIDMLKSELKKYRLGIIDGRTHLQIRDNIDVQFQQGKLDHLICNPECVKYGRNFSRSSTVIYYSEPNIETRHQSEDRILHIGKKEPLLYINLFVENSVETELMRAKKLREDEAYMIRLFTKRLLKKYERVK